MGKEKKFITVEVETLRKQTKRMLDNKYFMAWMNRYKFGGEDSSNKLDRKQKRFIMKRFWEDGTVACGKIKHLEGPEGLFFAPYLTQYYDLYYEPEVVEFVNLHNTSFIPSGPQVLGKTAAIGWCNSSRNGIRTIVNYFVERLTDLELTLNTNVLIQNMPFMMSVSPDQKVKANDIITRLLNHEPVIITDVNDIQAIQAVMTEAPFVADKLRQLYYDYENQLYTILGIDNVKQDSSKEFQLTSEIDANNTEINMFANDFDTCIKEFFEDIKNTFGVDIKVESTIIKADSMYAPDQVNKQPSLGGNNNDKESN